MSGTTTYVTWNRDGRTVQANNATATVVSIGSRLYAVTET
jgi:hypothetical protein